MLSLTALTTQCEKGESMTDIKQDEVYIVQQLTGITDDSRITVNNLGWTSRAYIIDDGEIVFKFPRDEQSRQDFAYELAALELIKQHKFAINTPVINWVSSDYEYIGLLGVPGNSITQDKISRLDDKVKKEIGIKIGLFLKQLHAIKPVEKPFVMTVKDQIAEYQKKYKAALPTLKTYFVDDDLQRIDDLFMKVMPSEMSNLGEELVFCHGDLGYNNILLTCDNELGIIDFGDAGLYDKSQDFTGLEDKMIQYYAINSYGRCQILKAKVNIRQKMLPVADILFYVGKSDPIGIKSCIKLIKFNMLNSPNVI